MASYRVVLKRPVFDELKNIPSRDLQLVIARIGELADDPYPDDSERLSERARFRVRVGDYRIVYEAEQQSGVVMVVTVGGGGRIN